MNGVSVVTTVLVYYLKFATCVKEIYTHLIL